MNATLRYLIGHVLSVENMYMQEYVLIVRENVENDRYERKI